MIELSEDQRERGSPPYPSHAEEKKKRPDELMGLYERGAPFLAWVFISDGSETNVASIDDFLQFNFLILSFEMRTYNQLLFKLQRFIISIMVSA